MSIEKHKRASNPAALGKPAGIRFAPAEREELQKGADEHADGNLSHYVRTLALEAHRARCASVADRSAKD